MSTVQDPLDGLSLNAWASNQQIPKAISFDACTDVFRAVQERLETTPGVTSSLKSKLEDKCMKLLIAAHDTAVAPPGGMNIEGADGYDAEMDEGTKIVEDTVKSLFKDIFHPTPRSPDSPSSSA